MPVTAPEMRKYLRELYFRDPDAQLCTFVKRRISDPVSPENIKGQFRINRLIVLLGVFVLFAIATFFYFTLVQP